MGLFFVFIVFQNTLIESGYMHEQATKPDTIGVSLTTSPSGLAAWILEKFSSCTNRDMSARDERDGGLRLSFNLDDLLTDVMIYWINGEFIGIISLCKFLVVSL